MWRILLKLQKNLVWAIPISMLVGIVFGANFDTKFLKAFIIPVTFVMVYPMMVTLNLKSVLSGQDTRLQLFTQVINFIIIPIIAFYIGKLLLSGQDPKYGLWAVGLFLIGVLPTSGMTISWTGFAKGNKEAATKMVVFGLVIGALAAPVYTKVFMGATVNVDMFHMFKQIALFVFVPMIAGIITQTSLKRKYGLKAWNDTYKPKFPPFSALGVVMIAFLAMSLKAKNIISNPADIVVIFVPLLVFYLLTYVMLSVAGKLLFKREDAVAMVFGVVMRDLSIALAIAMTAFGKEGTTIALLIALAYVIQIQSAAWYVRLVNKIFGQTKAQKAPLPATEPHLPSITPFHPAIEKDASTLTTAQTNSGLMPKFEKILYVTDLSDTAKHAIRHACSLGRLSHGDVTVLHVIPDMIEQFSLGTGINLSTHTGKNHFEDFNQKGIQVAEAAVRDRIQETYETLHEKTDQCPLSQANVTIKVGNPVEQIIATAETGNYDIVIMGTHGYGKIGQALVGSVASEVIRRCEKPVLTVHLPNINNQYTI